MTVASQRIIRPDKSSDVWPDKKCLKWITDNLKEAGSIYEICLSYDLFEQQFTTQLKGDQATLEVPLGFTAGYHSAGTQNMVELLKTLAFISPDLDDEGEFMRMLLLAKMPTRGRWTFKPGALPVVEPL